LLRGNSSVGVLCTEIPDKRVHEITQGFTAFCGSREQSDLHQNVVTPFGAAMCPGVGAVGSGKMHRRSQVTAHDEDKESV